MADQIQNQAHQQAPPQQGQAPARQHNGGYNNAAANNGANMQSTEPEALRNLIVNYIPTTVDEVQLRQLFENYGPIESIKIVFNKDTRQSRGFGFVKFQFAMSALQAINYLNGYPLMNKRLKVAYAKEQDAHVAQQQMYGLLMNNPMMGNYMMQQPQQQPPQQQQPRPQRRPQQPPQQQAPNQVPPQQ